MLVGFEGSEHNSLATWYKSHQAKHPYRIAFAINHHYPEFASGFYRNKRLEALIQEALLDIGLHVVVWDNYRKEGDVPEEILGGLEIADDYLLVDETLNILGRLNVWEDLGSKSSFYHDQLIMEVATDKKNGEELIRLTENKCLAKSIACSSVKGSE